MMWKPNRFFVVFYAAPLLCCLAGRPAAADAAEKPAQTADKARTNVTNAILSILWPGCKNWSRRAAQEYSVTGQANCPGTYSLPAEKDIRVVDAIAEAGGASYRGEQRRVTTTRLINGKSVTLNVNLLDIYNKGITKQNFSIQDGDVLFIPTRNLDQTGQPFLNPLYLFSTSVFDSGLFR